MTGAVAVVLTTAAALGWRRALAWALVAFLVEYGIALADRSGLDGWAPLVGAGSVLVGELTSRAITLQEPSTPDRPARIHMLEMLGYGLAAILIGVVVTAGAAAQPRANLLLEGASAASAVGVLLLITRLIRPPQRARRDRTAR